MHTTSTNLVWFVVESWNLVSIPEFSANLPDFPAKYQNFPQNHLRSLEFPKFLPIRRCVRWTEKYPILETFIFFITERRFGGVGAPEGRENVPDFIPLFPQNKKSQCFWRNMLDKCQKIPQNIPKLSAKKLKSGNLFCDFLADVKG